MTRALAFLLYHFFVQPLPQLLLRSIRESAFLRAGDRVALAVSGGADSVCLLRLLIEARSELGIVVSVAHVNHQLRGEESAGDQDLVLELAERFGLETHLCQAPVDPKGSSIEAVARKLRYDFFRRILVEGRATKVVTAHTLDDQAETVLMRIFRGTGIRGLAGIHPRIVVEDKGHVFGEIVRPLLNFRRSALIEFLRGLGQDWREDSSNRDTAFLRNRLRHRLLPIVAEEFGDAAIAHIGDLAEIARAEEEHWELREAPIKSEPRTETAGDTRRRRGIQGLDQSFVEETPINFSSKNLTLEAAGPHRLRGACLAGPNGMAEAMPFQNDSESGPAQTLLRHPEVPSCDFAASPAPALSLPREELLTLPLAAQRRTVRAWIEAGAPSVAISFPLIESVLEVAREGAGRNLELTSGWHLSRTRHEVRLEFRPIGDSAAAAKAQNYSYPLRVPGAVDIPELNARFEAQIVPPDSIVDDARGELRDQLLSPELVSQEIVIRNWRAGDRFWPAHTASEKKVKELLGDRPIAGREKQLWPVAVAEGRGLIWMRGFPVPSALRAPEHCDSGIWIRQLGDGSKLD